MSPDVWRMLLVGGALCVGGSLIIGAMVGIAVTRRRGRLDKEPAPREPAAPTAVYGPVQWHELLSQVEAETALLHRVDPTALPKPRSSRVYSAKRWLR